jgi:hypothetical protein
MASRAPASAPAQKTDHGFFIVSSRKDWPD